jgi:preprotein translocase subunit SecG
MFILLITLHLIAAAILILVVLLQSGKAGDLASTFGGATSQAAFGARGAATVLTKATTLSAIIFMFTSLGLSIFYTRQAGTTVMDNVETTPVAPIEQPTESSTPPVETPAETQEQPANESGGSEQEQ